MHRLEGRKKYNGECMGFLAPNRKKGWPRLVGSYWFLHNGSRALHFIILWLPPVGLLQLQCNATFPRLSSALILDQLLHGIVGSCSCNDNTSIITWVALQ